MKKNNPEKATIPMNINTKPSTPLVSIIIRTKNEERWIDHCLSAITQSKNFEIILVDNNSDDNSVKIAKKYTDKIINVAQFYPGKAINEGIRASSGKFVAYIWTLYSKKQQVASKINRAARK